MYWDSTNLLNQGNIRKGGGMKHHKDQDAPRSGVNRIQYLWTKNPNIWKWQTRIVSTDYEILQDRNWRNENHFRCWKNQFLRTMLCWEALREFNVITSQVGSTTNGYLKLIKEGFLSYFSTINVLNNQKCAMRPAMRKPWDLQINIFVAGLTELKHHLLLFPSSSAFKKIDPK